MARVSWDWIGYHCPMQLFNWARLVAPFAIDIGRVAWRHAVGQQRLPL